MIIYVERSGAAVTLACGLVGPFVTRCPLPGFGSLIRIYHSQSKPYVLDDPVLATKRLFYSGRSTMNYRKDLVKSRTTIILTCSMAAVIGLGGVAWARVGVLSGCVF